MKKFFSILIILILSGCATINLPGQATLTPTATAEPTATLTATPRATDTPPGPTTLHVWLPPQFDPQADTQAARLLQARLDQFADRRPNVRVDVRIKALDGPGGLLDSLTTASAAAPLALPDLIALPRPALETAALKGLLHPYDELSDALDNTDWYEYARQLARLQNSTFGIPFAGDALVMVYRPAVIAEPPDDFVTVLQSNSALAFPAADPQALLTLALYQAAGGAILDDQGRPMLEAGELNTVLTFYHQAASNEILPFWLTQFQGDAQAWDAYQEGQADMVITWITRFLQEIPADSAAAPLPTADGARFTLATGWVWALAGPDPEKQLLAVQLAEFLSESEFLSTWTAATGYLPARPSALSRWSTASLRPLASEVAQSAQVLPSADIFTSLAAPLEQATVEVLKLQTDPDTAAQEAVQSLANP